MAYLTRAFRQSLGVVISASHNPFHDNGIKFFSANGEKLPDEWEQEVEAALSIPPQWVDSKALGRARRVEDARGRYIEFCKSTFDSNAKLSLKGLKLVVDGAHGAAYQIAPAVLHELGAEVIFLNAADIQLGRGEPIRASGQSLMNGCLIIKQKSVMCGIGTIGTMVR